jgi:hypothetical protein
MPYDLTSRLWPDPAEHFFRDRELVPVQQQGPHCVSTALAILAQEAPSRFQGRINTQDPVSWSEALQPWEMKLAYCPFDVRKLRFYMDELVALDDLFLLCYYSPLGEALLADPDDRGWVCGSHVVVLHRDRVLDPLRGDALPAHEHPCNNHHTKRIFRVVPLDSPRGL